MAKSNLKIGNISFGSIASYDKFVSLDKEEQITRVAESLSPKDRVEAERLLTHIPNGEVNSRMDKTSREDNTARPSKRDGGHNPKHAKADKGGEA